MKQKNESVSDKTCLWQKIKRVWQKNMRVVKDRMCCERNMRMAKGNACVKRTHARQKQARVAERVCSDMSGEHAAKSGGVLGESILR